MYIVRTVNEILKEMRSHCEIISRNFLIIYFKFSRTIPAALLIRTIGRANVGAERPVRRR